MAGRAGRGVRVGRGVLVGLGVRGGLVGRGVRPAAMVALAMAVMRLGAMVALGRALRVGVGVVWEAAELASAPCVVVGRAVREGRTVGTWLGRTAVAWSSDMAVARRLVSTPSEPPQPARATATAKSRVASSGPRRKDGR